MKTKESAVKFIIDNFDDRTRGSGRNKRYYHLTIENCILEYKEVIYHGSKLDNQNIETCHLSNLDPSKVKASAGLIWLSTTNNQYNINVSYKYEQSGNILERNEMSSTMDIYGFMRVESVAKAFSYLIASCGGQEGW